MGISRRTVIASGLAVGGVGAAAFWATPDGEAASQPGDVVGKVTVGYQGWFAAPGDGAPINGWWHWSRDWSQAPSPSQTAVKCWPDLREYTKGYRTNFSNLGNGQPANLYSSYDQQTVDTQFRWMQEHGCDTAALQRFNPTGGEGPTRDAMAQKVRQAAEATGRKFYIMYDVSGWTAMQGQIKTDWTSKMAAHTNSSAYARQNGKPVVGIWGFGFNDENHPWNAGACLDVIAWFKAQGCYVMGGVPTHWRLGTDDSRAGYLDVYHAFDMLSPWMVGRIGDAAGSDWFYTNRTVGDLADCAAHGIDYQPCVLPGDMTVPGQRANGDLMWRQFYNFARAGVQSVYISMFDEYNEGNQIAKSAENASMVPAGSGLRALDADGIPCSSDYYLRITADGGRMLKGQLALTATRPTQPVGGTTPPPTTPPTGTAITLRSKSNGQYVCAEGGGDQALIANRATVGDWERFELVDAGGGDVALRSKANGRYVCADAAGAQPLIANRVAIGQWEKFQLVSNPNGTVSLLARANGKYVCAESGGDKALIANRAAIGPWEQFDRA